MVNILATYSEGRG